MGFTAQFMVMNVFCGERKNFWRNPGFWNFLAHIENGLRPFMLKKHGLASRRQLHLHI